MRLFTDHPVYGDYIDVVVLEESEYLGVFIVRELPMSSFLVNLRKRKCRDANAECSKLGVSQNMFCNLFAIDAFGDLSFQPSNED